MQRGATEPLHFCLRTHTQRSEPRNNTHASPTRLATQNVSRETARHHQSQAQVTTDESTIVGMELEWDTAKAVVNLKKHGISFEDAERVFYDLGRIETYDGRENYGEDRWATIGLVYSAVLYVVYTIRNRETVRLISARKANAYEQKQYREAQT